MRGPICVRNRTDENGQPAGGSVTGRGFAIVWQDEPLGRGETRREPTGAFVEDVIAAARARLEWYQTSGFECTENSIAIYHLDHALTALDDRTKRRELAGVEGTHQGD